ncbi:MAG: hypothetical protein JRE40_11625 [Deltaproteobacteria bacterium]|nr:hypothetical protein [Deltaproteobacteria bacterium]
MNTDRHLFIMRNLYTGLQAETMVRYVKAGILGEIEKEKKLLSLASGEKTAQMLGVTRPEEAFTKPAAVVGCAVWEIDGGGNGLKAVCNGCKLVAMCKQFGAPSPCGMYCLNGIEGMIKALKPEASFMVQSTLWSGENCTVDVAW